MTQNEIIKKYGVDINDFRKFLVNTNARGYYEAFMGGVVVEDHMIEKHISSYRKYLQEEQVLTAVQKRIEEEETARKKKAMAEMLITSGFNFDGYTIKKYSGYISGDDAMSVDRGISFLGLGGDSARDELMSSLAKIRRNALRELKEAAYDLGCNAVIGVDFDYITLDPQTHNIGGGTKLQPYVFGVTANGNAVIIEKDED